MGQGGLTPPSSVVNLIRDGEVGSLVDLYHTLNADSKVLTDYSASTNGDQTRFQPFLDNAQPGIEKGRASYDLTHAFKGNFVYDPPFGKGHKWAPSNGLVSQLVSGWQVASIFTWQSGSPFSILSQRGTLNRVLRSGFNTAFSSLTPQQLKQFVNVSFTTTAGKVLGLDPRFIGPNGAGAPQDALICTPIITGGFCNPAPGTLGDIQRNAFSGPPFFNWDFSASKSFHISESKRLEYRAEFFNFLNHPVFFMGDQLINGSTFGQITSTSSTPRVIQMALRFIF